MIPKKSELKRDFKVMSQKELLKKYRIGYKSLIRILDDYGIKRRTLSEAAKWGRVRGEK